jgi:uncharacterized protein
MNLYDIVIPPVTRNLVQVPRWLDKAQAYAEQKKFDPEVLLAARLAPNQWPLSQQIKVIALAPRRFVAMVRGQEMPGYEEGEATIAKLRESLAASLELVQSVKPEEFEGVEDRIVPLPFMPGKGMKGSDFLIQFALPNTYFHVVTAYAILRHNGVDVGKMDYIGELTGIRDL